MQHSKDRGIIPAAYEAIRIPYGKRQLSYYQFIAYCSWHINTY